MGVKLRRLLLICRPGGPAESSPRREPWDAGPSLGFPSPGKGRQRVDNETAFNGRGTESAAPTGAGISRHDPNPRLTPWAISCRRSAAPGRSIRPYFNAYAPPSPLSRSGGRGGRRHRFPRARAPDYVILPLRGYGAMRDTQRTYITNHWDRTLVSCNESALKKPTSSLSVRPCPAGAKESSPRREKL